MAQRGEKLELLIDKTENLVDSVSTERHKGKRGAEVVCTVCSNQTCWYHISYEEKLILSSVQWVQVEQRPGPRAVHRANIGASRL